MWLGSIRFRHDCTVGNRMRKFNLMTHITFLGSYFEKGQRFSIGMHRIIGDKDKIKAFYKEFKRDPNVIDSQLNENIMVCTEKSSELPIGKFKSKIFFQKPIFIDNQGYEHWEFFSFDRKLINEFISKIGEKCDEIVIEKIVNTKLNDFYFPHAIPKLTEKQKRALELALEKGYFAMPRKTDIRTLAKQIGISKSTFQDTLRRAEAKIIPDLMNMNILE